jgi:Helix-turn-helix domain
VAQALKKGTRVIGVDRSRLGTLLGKRYDSGESIRSLAASTGRSYGFVHRLLTESGVELRRRGGATRSHPARSGKNGVKNGLAKSGVAKSGVAKSKARH